VCRPTHPVLTQETTLRGNSLSSLVHLPLGEGATSSVFVSIASHLIHECSPGILSADAQACVRVRNVHETSNPHCCASLSGLGHAAIVAEEVGGAPSLLRPAVGAEVAPRWRCRRRDGGRRRRHHHRRGVMRRRCWRCRRLGESGTPAASAALQLRHDEVSRSLHKRLHVRGHAGRQQDGAAAGGKRRWRRWRSWRWWGMRRMRPKLLGNWGLRGGAGYFGGRLELAIVAVVTARRLHISRERWRLTESRGSKAGGVQLRVSR
jgi:hypothetical protein